MRILSKRLVLPALALPLAWFAIGCDSTKVELESAPPPPSSVTKIEKIEDMPKAQRPRVGGSGGMNYDPSGTTPK